MAEHQPAGFARGVLGAYGEWFKRVGKDGLWGVGGGVVIGTLLGVPALGAGLGGLIGLIRGAIRHK